MKEGEYLLKGNLDDFGRLLGRGWELKKSLASGITNPGGLRRSTGVPSKRVPWEARFAGQGGGKLKDMVQECLIVPSNSMERVEDVHLILGHLLCCYLRELLR